MKRFLAYKWELVVLLFLAFFFNQADRQIFNVLLPDIQSDLGLSKGQLGLVATVLTFVYGILVPVAGLLGGKVRKKNIIVVALIVWSTATMMTGFAGSLLALILLRSIATGGGEAFYAPSANALISESHGSDTRATALSIHQTALYLGFIFSGIIASSIAQAYGWRNAFYVFGGFGILLAVVLFFRIKNNPSGESGAQVEETPKAGVRESVRAFFRCPSALWITASCAGLQFAGYAFFTWMPTYMRENPSFGLTPTQAAFHATFFFQLASIAGVMVGARLADRLVSRHPLARGWVQVTGFLAGAPFMYLMARGQSLWLVDAMMVGFGFFKGMYDSNMIASLYDVVEEKYRSSATSFMLMVGFIIGAISPYLLGALAPKYGLSFGLTLGSFVYFASAFPILTGTLFTFKKDILKVKNKFKTGSGNS